MNKKGFTLVELLAVIVILGIILIIAVPSSINLSKKVKAKMYSNKIANITKSAVLWGQDNLECLQKNTGSADSTCANVTCTQEDNIKSCTLKVGDLAAAGYVDYDNDKIVTNPQTGDSMNDETVLIKFNVKTKLVAASSSSIVPSLKLSSITLDTSKVKKEFAVNSSFTSDGLIVTAIYSDNSTKDVSSQAIINNQPNMTEAKKDVSVSVSYTENSVTVSGTYQISIAYIYNKFSCSPNYTWGQYTINSNGSYSYTVTNNLVTYHYSDFVGFGLSNAYLSSFNTSSGYFTTLVSDSIVSSSDLSYINTKDNVFYGNDYDEFNVFNASSGYKRYKLVSHDPSTQTIKGYFIEVTQEQTMGNYIKDISSTTRTEYPDNGIQSSYWYKYNGTSNVVNKAAGSSKLNSYSQLTTGYCISDSGNYYYYESV